MTTSNLARILNFCTSILKRKRPSGSSSASEIWPDRSASVRGKSGSYSQGLVVTRTDGHCKLGKCVGYRVDAANTAVLSEPDISSLNEQR